MVDDKSLPLCVMKPKPVQGYYLICPDIPRKPGVLSDSQHVITVGRGHGKIPPGRKIVMGPKYTTAVLDG